MCFAEQTDKWLIKLLFDVCITDNKLLPQYIGLLNGHWELIYTWISEERLLLWEILVDISGDNLFKEKLAKRKEDYFIVNNGLKLNEIQKEPIVNNSNSEYENYFTDEWKDVSDLRSYGYEVSKKTDEERRAALKKALIHMPVSKIINHIQWLLKNSYKKDGLRGDYSKSIKAYESDLEYLKTYFNS